MDSRWIARPAFYHSGTAQDLGWIRDGFEPPYSTDQPILGAPGMSPGAASGTSGGPPKPTNPYSVFPDRDGLYMSERPPPTPFVPSAPHRYGFASASSSSSSSSPSSTTPGPFAAYKYDRSWPSLTLPVKCSPSK